jgi:uncharacterized RDD family membrane protein YckC
MAKISVQTSQNVRIDFELASLGDRILAYLIDGAVMVGYLIAIGLLVMIFGRAFRGTNELGEAVAIVLLCLLYLPLLCYNLLCEVFFNGQTIGKRQMKIKVIKLDGSQPTLGAYLLRWLLRPIDIGLYGIVAILCIVIGGKGQRLGDIAAGTSLIKLKEMPAYSSHELLKSVPENYIAVFPEVVNLKDSDITLIKEAIEVYRKTENSRPVVLAADNTKTLLGIQNSQPPLIFLEQIVKDYSLLTAVA